MTFEQAFDLTMEFEGGDTLHRVPGDPGGLTRFGLSQRAHPELDLETITRADARVIYREKYWDAVQADQLPAVLRWDVFDTAVNSGVATAGRTLQRSINLCLAARRSGAKPLRLDGQIGPVTLSAAWGWPERVRGVFRAYRTRHYLFLAEEREQEKFIHGWLDRVNGKRGDLWD